MKIVIKDTNVLREKILKSGRSIREFGRNASISQMGEFLNGNRHPSPRTAKKIADTLQVEFDEIFDFV